MEKAVCFIGHRKINDTPLLRMKLQDLLPKLIKRGAVNFLFGDHSDFNDLCYSFVTELKKTYPHIKRIHFRTNYENADAYTMQFLLDGFEDSICPVGMSKAGVGSYVKRNCAMIDESKLCVFYYDENYLPPRRTSSNYNVTDYQPRSGTAVAYNYAVSKNKRIINLF